MFRLIKFFVVLIIISLNIYGESNAEDLKKLRIGSLQYGSVNWELKLIKELQLDKKNNAISSTGSSGTGGAITAALFLNRFIDKNTNWAHVDLMAWNTSSRPGFPVGGEAMGLRNIVNMIIKYCSKS